MARSIIIANGTWAIIPRESLHYTPLKKIKILKKKKWPVWKVMSSSLSLSWLKWEKFLRCSFHQFLYRGSKVLSCILASRSCFHHLSIPPLCTSSRHCSGLWGCYSGTWRKWFLLSTSSQFREEAITIVCETGCDREIEWHNKGC